MRTAASLVVLVLTGCQLRGPSTEPQQSFEVPPRGAPPGVSEKVLRDMYFSQVLDLGSGTLPTSSWRTRRRPSSGSN
jgi:hypothetical protein